MQQQETIHAVMAPLDDDFIRSRILTIRGVQVMLDRDLATLYGVDAKRINEQVKRNAERFPEDFMFRLTKDECLRSQIATLNMERGKHLKYMPHAFTESGGADVLIATTHKSATKFISPTAVAKFNKQNPTLTIKTVGSFHDRFLILDGTELYHFGASMKDLGRQYCATTKTDAMFIPSIMQRIP